jgi:hypothetical protein
MRLSSPIKHKSIEVELDLAEANPIFFQYWCLGMKNRSSGQ